MDKGHVLCCRATRINTNMEQPFGAQREAEDSDIVQAYFKPAEMCPHKYETYNNYGHHADVGLLSYD